VGRSEYTQRFAENGITVAALRYLTDQDLKDIGVLLGHRRIMLAAITSLNDTPTVASPAQIAVPAPQSPAVATSAPELVGERRHVTVMFCDLLDSTGIAARLDAEDWRDLVGAQIGAAHGCSAAAVALAWAVRSGKVIAIPESGSPAHVKENAVALSLTLTPEELQTLEMAFPGPSGAK
jgi:hypothetical protein